MTASPRQTRPQPAAPPATLPPAEELDAVLRRLLAEHEALLEITRRHKGAIARADLEGIQACVDEQNGAVSRITALEQRRQALAGRILGPKGAQQKPTLAATVRGMGEPAASRLLDLGARLRELIQTVQNENRTLRAAAEALAAHMEGLMRQITRAASHAGTYARSGSIDSSVQVVSALDLRS